jgi:class 3 adenylate cyclase
MLADHRRLMRAAFAAFKGHEVGTEGDSFFVVFPTAREAVAAAVEVQCALAAHEWPEDAAVRVRMGLRIGEGRRAGGGYVGIDVHRATRVDLAGHGGQVLISGTTEEHGEMARYRMLETIRQYATEKLIESGDEPSVRRHHFNRNIYSKIGVNSRTGAARWAMENGVA